MDERDKWSHLKLKVAETSVMQVEDSLETVNRLLRITSPAFQCSMLRDFRWSLFFNANSHEQHAQNPNHKLSLYVKVKLSM
jgi:hypothetical protein